MEIALELNGPFIFECGESILKDLGGRGGWRLDKHRILWSKLLWCLTDEEMDPIIDTHGK